MITKFTIINVQLISRIIILSLAPCRGVYKPAGQHWCHQVGRQLDGLWNGCSAADAAALGCSLCHGPDQTEPRSIHSLVIVGTIIQYSWQLVFCGFYRFAFADLYNLTKKPFYMKISFPSNHQDNNTMNWLYADFTVLFQWILQSIMNYL